MVMLNAEKSYQHGCRKLTDFFNIGERTATMHQSINSHKNNNASVTGIIKDVEILWKRWVILAKAL